MTPHIESKLEEISKTVIMPGDPLIAKYIMNHVAGDITKIKLLLILGGVLLIIYLIKAGLNFIIQYWGHIVVVRIQGDMRKELFQHFYVWF